MRLVPKKTDERIAFFQAHLDVFAERAEQIGITPADAAELAALTAEAREAYRAQRMAMQAARSATGRLREAMAKMSRSGSGIILKVRAKAQTSGGDAIYALAHITPPQQASPVGTPGKPGSFSSSLCVTGPLTLRWKCKHPRGCDGVVYQIWRSVGGSHEYEPLGTVGEKMFVDQSLPMGAGQVTYRVQALRSTTAGPVATYSIDIGVAPGTQPDPMIASMAQRRRKLMVLAA